jgi:hypothetical protein
MTELVRASATRLDRNFLGGSPVAAAPHLRLRKR